jgi:hypothetical protein
MKQVKQTVPSVPILFLGQWDKNFQFSTTLLPENGKYRMLENPAPLPQAAPILFVGQWGKTLSKFVQTVQIVQVLILVDSLDKEYINQLEQM